MHNDPVVAFCADPIKPFLLHFPACQVNAVIVPHEQMKLFPFSQCLVYHSQMPVMRRIK